MYESEVLASLNVIFHRIVGIDLETVIQFYNDHGEFATSMLLGSQIGMHQQGDVMRDAVCELARDSSFMKDLPPELRAMVYTAVGNA